MCGICGIIDFPANYASTERAAIVQAMNNRMQHRGPDESGSYAGTEVTMAMRRLAIIDLAGGSQPIRNETEDVVAILNGEIYNYRELREQLVGQGHHFQTESDTEVLVHLYEEYGKDLVAHLRGMFAFCLYDQRRQYTLLARDPFGEKPLHYHQQVGSVSFASELHALLANPRITRRLNHEALPYYLRTSLVPAPLTFFQDIHSLPPGHLLEIDARGATVSPYFRIQYAPDETIRSEGDAIALIEPRLRTAVRRQLVSDVPLGAFLSGGIDSSTIVALVQQAVTQPVKTFTVRFEEKTYDESQIARQVAEHCGTEHHELTIPNHTFSPELFWLIIEQVGQPFRDSSAIPSYFVTQQIRKHVKVALSGDGGDELFAGYSLFHWYQRILRLRRIPAGMRSSAAGVLRASANVPGLRQLSVIRRLERALRTSLLDELDIALALNEFFTTPQLSQLLGATPHYGRLQTYPEEVRAQSALRQIMYYRCQFTLPDNMLVKVDRMSMANSLEVRAPFLDLDLFMAAAKLPDRFLMREGVGKYLLRRIMATHLPASVFDHPKQGFSIPLYNYQNEDFRALAHDLLLDNNPWPHFFSRSFLQKVLQYGLQQKRDTAQRSAFQASHQLWMMMQLLGWARKYRIQL